MKDIIFKIWSVNIDGAECNGDEREVKGNAIKVIDDVFYIGRVSEVNTNGKWIKLSDGFNLNYRHNEDKITVTDIANLMINGGRTESHIYKTLSISKEITVEELANYIGNLYLNWWEDEGIEDFPSYRLSGLHRE